MSLIQLMMKLEMTSKERQDQNEMDEEIVEGQDGDNGDNRNEGETNNDKHSDYKEKPS